jgi:hypothetical protein
MGRKPKSLLFATAVALAVTACASATGRTGALASAGSAPARSEAVTLNVTNHSVNDVDVYALIGEIAQQVAMVPSTESKRVKLPSDADLTGGVRLVVNPVGTSTTYSSGKILVGSGNTINLTVASPLDRSYWSVR